MLLGVCEWVYLRVWELYIAIGYSAPIFVQLLAALLSSSVYGFILVTLLSLFIYI